MMPAVVFAKLSSFFFAATSCAHSFFFLPSWWEYLDPQPDPKTNCTIPSFDFPHDTLAVGLAILDILLRVAGFVAVVAIIIAGVEHIFSGGDAQKAAAARSRLWNSIIGLALAMTATAIVTFIGNQLK